MQKFSSKRKIGERLLDLSLDQKLIGIGSIIVLISTYLPWYTYGQLLDDIVKSKTVVLNAFSGDTFIIGYIVFLFALLSLIHIILDFLNLPLPRLPGSEPVRHIFLAGESLFLLIILLIIFNSYELSFSRGYSDGGAGFGIFIAIIGEILILVGGRLFSITEKRQEKQLEKQSDKFAHFPTETKASHTPNSNIKSEQDKDENKEEEEEDPRMKMNF